MRRSSRRPRSRERLHNLHHRSEYTVKLFNIRRLVISLVGFAIAAVGVAWWEGIAPSTMFWNLVSVAVFIGGWLNAYGLATQTYALHKAGRGEGHSMQMYGTFLFIQVSLALNGVQHNDWMQASGLFASMVPTIWTMVLIHRLFWASSVSG